MTSTYGDVPLLDPATGRFPDQFAPPSVAQAVTDAEAARDQVVALDESYTTQGRSLLTAPTPDVQRRELSLDILQAEVDRVQRTRLGVVGTSGKPVISFRIDHGLDEFLTNIQPLLKSRFMPYSYGVVTGSIGNPAAGYEPTTKTWADIRTKISYLGGECWSHSRTHGDGASLESEIVGSRDDMLANWLQPAGWVQPGGPATYGPLNAVDQLDGPAGRLIRATYPLFEAYLGGSFFRNLPTHGTRGLNHLTIDSLTLAKAKEWVDRAVAGGLGLQIMLHPTLIGKPGYMSLADLEALLDYVKGLWDADTIEVMSASGLAFADPSSTYRRSMMPHGDLEHATTASKPYPWRNAAFWTVGTDGGHSGSNYLRLGASQSTAQYTMEDGAAQWMAGGTYLFEGWYRTGHEATPTSRPYMIIRSGSAGLGGTQVIRADIFPSSATSPAWARVRVPFSIPRDATSLTLEIGKIAADAGYVDWDDMRVTAI